MGSFTGIVLRMATYQSMEIYKNSHVNAITAVRLPGMGTCNHPEWEPAITRNENLGTPGTSGCGNRD